MNIESVISDATVSGKAPTGRPVIELKGLTKHYGKVKAVEGIDLTVYKGEIFGFLGPNGAGKTTTIRTMMDFIRKTRGDARMLGLDCHEDSIALRKRTGYLPGEFGLYEGFKVADFLRYMLHLRGALDKMARMRELAEFFDLPLDRKIRELSKGNRQKVGLVQAFMHDPELVILDEPTGGLDPLMQQRFYTLVRKEQQAGRTIFMSSHLLAEVEHVCDRVAIIREGHLVLVNSISNLKDSVGKVLTVTFNDEVDLSELDLEGIDDLRRDGRTYTMTIRSGIDRIIKAVASHSVQSMTVETYSLEELFLELYSGGKDDDEDEDDDGEDDRTGKAEASPEPDAPAEDVLPGGEG